MQNTHNIFFPLTQCSSSLKLPYVTSVVYQKWLQSARRGDSKYTSRAVQTYQKLWKLFLFDLYLYTIFSNYILGLFLLWEIYTVYFLVKDIISTL